MMGGGWLGFEEGGGACSAEQMLRTLGKDAMTESGTAPVPPWDAMTPRR